MQSFTCKLTWKSCGLVQDTKSFSNLEHRGCIVLIPPVQPFSLMHLKPGRFSAKWGKVTWGLRQTYSWHRSGQGIWLFSFHSSYRVWKGSSRPGTLSVAAIVRACQVFLTGANLHIAEDSHERKELKCKVRGSRSCQVQTTLPFKCSHRSEKINI